MFKLILLLCSLLVFGNTYTHFVQPLTCIVAKAMTIL